MALTTDPAGSTQGGSLPTSGTQAAAAPSAGSPAPGATRLVSRDDLVGGVVAAVAVLLTGAPVGLLWAALAPRAELVALGNGAFRLVNVEDRAFIGQDLLLFLLCVLAGVAFGVLGWVLGHRRAVGVVLGLAVGGFAAAWVAQRTGVLVDAARGSFAAGTRSAADGVPLDVPNAILRTSHRSRLLLLGWPAASALTFAALAYWRLAPPHHRQEPGVVPAPTPQD